MRSTTPAGFGDVPVGRLHRIFEVPPPDPRLFDAREWLNPSHDIPAGAPISGLLVVDPDPSSLSAMKACLEGAAHRVRAAASATEALTLAREEVPDFLITELVLPDVSGLGLFRSFREDPALARVPIMMVTASASEVDRVVAFEVGVDDFVPKPFHPRELLLRVAAILRRLGASGDRMGLGDRLAHQRLILDFGQHQARVDGQPVSLTAREFDVLARLMQNAGRPLSRRQLLEGVWGLRSGKTLRVVDTHVKWIRRKLGPVGHYIETLRGVGYRFTDLEAAPAALASPPPFPAAGANLHAVK